MDAFPDGAFVRLESRVLRGKFVHADEDWERVSLRPNGAVVPALNSVWRVQHWVNPEDGNTTYVALQNAAYGRYLSYSMKKAQRGHRGSRATQRDRSEPNVGQHYPWMWFVERLPAPDDQAYVTLRYFTAYLRANGRYLPWNIRVTADLDPDMPRVSTMMHWRVYEVPASPVPQPLPLALEHQGDDIGQFFPHPPRTIRHVQANNQGEFDQNHHNWPSFAFYDSSVILLKNQLRLHQGWGEDDMAAYTLCMRPGSHGRLMPLVTAFLPSSLDSMNIVVIRNGTPAAAALSYPAPPPA